MSEAEMVEVQSLDEIMNGDEATPVVEETAGTTDDAGQDTAAEETGGEAEDTAASAEAEATGEVDAKESGSPPDDDAKTADGQDEAAGLKAELARVREQNRRLKEAQEKPAPKAKEKTDFFDDPDKALEEVRNEMRQEFQGRMLDMSEAAARENHDDFDEKFEVFENMAKDDPSLWGKMGAHANPAEFAYRAAANHQKILDMGDPSTYEARIRAEERKKVEAEFNKNLDKKLQERGNLPTSLSDTRAAGGNTQPSVGEETLDDIIGSDASHR